MMMKKTNNKSSLGRQKIPIAKIAKRTNLQVTFSKRRSGLFKKASELCTLCGVEVAIVIFSPAKKPYSFGHPDVDSLIDRFLTRNPSFNMSTLADSYSQQLVESHKSASARDLNLQLTNISSQVEAERKRGESLDKMSGASEQCWWENPIDELGLEELKILEAAMEELKKNVNGQATRMWMESSNTTVTTTNNSSSFFMMKNTGSSGIPGASDIGYAGFSLY